MSPSPLNASSVHLAVEATGTPTDHSHQSPLPQTRSHQGTPEEPDDVPSRQKSRFPDPVGSMISLEGPFRTVDPSVATDLGHGGASQDQKPRTRDPIHPAPGTTLNCRSALEMTRDLSRKTKVSCTEPPHRPTPATKGDAFTLLSVKGTQRGQPSPQLEGGLHHLRKTTC